MATVEHGAATLSISDAARRTGMPIRTLRRYAELARDGEGNEAERLELLECHRRAVLDRLQEVASNLEAIDRKIAVYREKLAAG
jgi:DNA-binding transcriptional MerR regulator